MYLFRRNAQPASTSLGDDRLKNRTGLFGSAKLGAQCGCCMATRLRKLEIDADSLKIPSDTFQSADFLPRIMLGVCTSALSGRLPEMSYAQIKHVPEKQN